MGQNNLPKYMDKYVANNVLDLPSNIYKCVYKIYKGYYPVQEGGKDTLSSLFFALVNDTNDLAIVADDGTELAKIKNSCVGDFISAIFYCANSWVENISKSLEPYSTINKILKTYDYNDPKVDVYLTKKSNYYMEEMKKYRKLYFETLLNPIIKEVAKEPTLSQHIPDEIFGLYPELSEKIIEERKSVIQSPASYSKSKKLLDVLRKIEDEERPL